MYRGKRETYGTGQVKRKKIYRRSNGVTLKDPSGKPIVERIVWDGYGYFVYPVTEYYYSITAGERVYTRGDRRKVWGSGGTRQECLARIAENVALVRAEFEANDVEVQHHYKQWQLEQLDREFVQAQEKRKVIEAVHGAEELLGLGYTHPVPTISQFIESWFDSPLSARCSRHGGKWLYNAYYQNHIRYPYEVGKRAIGDYHLDELTRSVMLDFDLTLARERQAYNSKGEIELRPAVSSKYFFEIRNFLRRIYKEAMGSDFSAWNERVRHNVPGEHKVLRPVGTEKKNMQAISTEQFVKLLQTAVNLGNKSITAAIILSAHGIRPAAARALKWSDYDAAEHSVDVRHQLQYVDSVEQFVPTKNNETGVVWIAQDMVPLLEWCRMEGAEHIVCNPVHPHRWASDSAQNRDMLEVRAASGVQVTLMELRDFYATSGMERGIAPSVIAAGMHHKSDHMVRLRYGNRTRDRAVQTANDAILSCGSEVALPA